MRRLLWAEEVAVAEWADGWLARLAHVQPKTGVGYESLVRTCVLPAFGTTPLARVEQPAVAAWVAEMRARGLSASRIRQAYRVLSSLMAAAVQGGYIADDLEGVGPDPEGLVFRGQRGAPLRSQSFRRAVWDGRGPRLGSRKGSRRTVCDTPAPASWWPAAPTRWPCSATWATGT